MSSWITRHLIALGTLCFSISGHTRKTNFSDVQRGLILGAGLYVDALKTPSNQFDPVKQMTDNVNFSDVNAYKRYPTRFGVFWGGPISTFQLYGRYNFNSKKQWSRIDAPEGTGLTKLRSWGFGSQLDLSLVSFSRFRFMLSLNAEFLNHKANLRFQPTGDSLQQLSLGASNVLLAAGFSTEVWLIDLWALSLFTGYQHSQPSTWSVKGSGGEFFETNYSPGKLLNADRQTASSSKMGGILLEATLRLAFFTP